MKYFYFRLFLLQRAQLPLPLGQPSEGTSRSEYLKLVFSQVGNFIHRRQPFTFLPLQTMKEKDGVIILAKIGKPVTEIVNEPPDKDFREAAISAWRAADIIIDTRESADGQKAIVQFLQNVGRPPSILDSLIASINERNADGAYEVIASKITDPKGFWDAVALYGNQITSAKFSFVTPNLWGTKRAIEAELKRLQTENAARKVEMTIKNEETGVNLTGKNVAESVDYISAGGGSAQLKAGKKVVYNSGQNQKIVELQDDVEPARTDADRIQSAARRLL